MTDAIDYQIIGDDMQMVEVELDPVEGVRAEAGAMTYMETASRCKQEPAGAFLEA